MPITWHNKYKFAIFASREFGNQSSIAREAILHKKNCNIHSFIHSHILFTKVTMYPTLDRMFTNIRDSLASTSTCVCWSRDRERIQFSVRGRKRYGTCVRLASSFVVSYAMIMHHHHRTPSPPSRAVIHKSSEIRPRFLLQSIPDRVTSSGYAACNTSAARESIMFYL